MIDFVDSSFDPVKGLLEDLDKQLDEVDEITEVKEVNEGYRLRFLEKFNFEWTPSQKAYLTVIHSAANNLVSSILLDAIVILDSLYSKARVVEKGKNGLALRDENDRIVWETDASNRPIEDWKSVTTSDLENTWMRLSQVKYEVTQAVARLYTEAVFAKMSYKDDFYDKYSVVIEGTINEKTAAAERAHRKEKYRAFSRYCLWYEADQIAREITNCTRAVEKLREWRNWTKS